MDIKKAIAWQKSLCNNVKEGGTWVVPRSEATYQIFNRQKRAVVSGNSDDAVDLVFEKMGWTLEKN